MWRCRAGPCIPPWSPSTRATCAVSGPARDLLRAVRQSPGQAGGIPARRPGRRRRCDPAPLLRSRPLPDHPAGPAGLRPQPPPRRTAREHHLGSDRRHRGPARAGSSIERWLVFGGSWGSTLSLLYAEAHPERVTGLVLRGIFLLRPAEIAWFYQQGASDLYPDAWEPYLGLHPGRRARRPAPRLPPAPDRSGPAGGPGGRPALVHLGGEHQPPAGLGLHRGALRRRPLRAGLRPHRGPLLRQPGLHGRARPDPAGRGPHRGIFPRVIVQGRYDVVCPMRSAWDLHRAWPEAELRIVPDAGHSAFEPGIVHELITATDKFAPVNELTDDRPEPADHQRADLQRRPRHARRRAGAPRAHRQGRAARFRPAGWTGSSTPAASTCCRASSTTRCISASRA